MANPPSQQSRQHQIASVVEDVDSRLTDTEPISEVDRKVISRIKKCLALAEDPSATEAEAQAAMRMSRRLMADHNLSRADLITAQAESDEPSNITGATTVRITHPNKEKNVVYETWTGPIAAAVCKIFDCKSYTQICFPPKKFDRTFYGIATNASAAALGFEIAHNITQDWASKLKKGNKNSYRLGVADGLWKIACQEEADLKKAARQREEDDLAKRVQVESEARQREIDRLQVGPDDDHDNHLDGTPASTSSPGRNLPTKSQTGPEMHRGKTALSSNSIKHENDIVTKCEDNDAGGIDLSIIEEYSDSDSEIGGNNNHIAGADFTSDESSFDLDADFKDEIKRHMPHHVSDLAPPPSQPSCPSPPVSDHLIQCETDEKSDILPYQKAGALIRLRDCAMKLADQYLELKNVKLSKGRKRSCKIVDHATYKRGQEDSKNIDVKCRRIKGPESTEVIVKTEIERLIMIEGDGVVIKTEAE